MIEFEINTSSNELVIMGGLVVTVGSTVTRGLQDVKMPKADTALQSLKRILGIRRKKQPVVEEEEAPVAVESDDDDDSANDDSDDESEEQEEIIDDSD
jgi:hypothetical protein